MFTSIYAAEYEESYWRRNGKSDHDFSQCATNFWRADLRDLFLPPLLESHGTDP